MKVHLVDGTYELFRAYYGVPPAHDAAGRPVGAVRGILATLLSLLREPGVTHVACAFDHVIESFRNELFAGYKTGEGIDPDLLGAVRAGGAGGCGPRHRRLADGRVRGRRRPRHRGRALPRRPRRRAGRDLLARQGPVAVRRRQPGHLPRPPPRTDRDEAGVVAKFGVPPSSIPDWLALVGDTADGIPGIPGWGEKSAGAVLARYGRLEAIPDDPAALGRGGARARPPGRVAPRAARGRGALPPARDAAHRRAARGEPRGPRVAGRAPRRPRGALPRDRGRGAAARECPGGARGGRLPRPSDRPRT